MSSSVSSISVYGGAVRFVAAPETAGVSACVSPTGDASASVRSRLCVSSPHVHRRSFFRRLAGWGRRGQALRIRGATAGSGLGWGVTRRGSTGRTSDFRPSGALRFGKGIKSNPLPVGSRDAPVVYPRQRIRERPGRDALVVQLLAELHRVMKRLRRRSAVGVRAWKHDERLERQSEI